MNKKENRKKELLTILQMSNSLSVQEVSEMLNISQPTARRLCAELASEYKILRLHGSIKKLELNNENYSFDKLENEHLEEKKRIAEYAANMVQDHQVIFVESGTTLSQLVHCLTQRLQNGELSNVIIFTNSLINLNILAPFHDKIMLIGGHYRNYRKDFSGYLSEIALSGLHFNQCFIGADAISYKGGMMAMDADTVHFDKELIKHAENTIVLAHADKFEKSSLISYASVKEVSAIITDTALSHEIYEEYHKNNIALTLV